jgi:hypothetical protein
MNISFSYTLLVICIIIVILLIYINTSELNRLNYDRRCSKYFENCRVYTHFNDFEKASKLLFGINKFAEDLIRHMKHIYLENGNGKINYSKNNINTYKLMEYYHGEILTKRLINGYNPLTLIENDTDDPTKTSYVKNKGEILALCLREKKTGKDALHDYNLLLFVLIHELAHIASISTIHDTEFWINFKFLLEFADKYNLYKSPNFSENNINYCGLNITFNPAYSSDVKSYFNYS